MIIPQRRLCDLCRNEIDHGDPFCGLTYPVDREELRQLMVAPPQGPRIEILGLSDVVGLPPAHYQFEICVGCIDGLLPMLAALKTDYIQRWIKERDRRAAARMRGND